MQTSNLGRAIRKIFLSALVIVTFAAYVLQQQLSQQSQNIAAARSINGFSRGQQIGNALRASPVPTQNDLAMPVATNTPFAPTIDTPESPASTPTAEVRGPTDTPVPATDTPEPLPSPTATTQGAYKDGTYTGPEVDAYYGLVQVQVTVLNGQISDVSFLDYPHDRRTSQEINSQAAPWLQQEAIQAQSANVDLISGATLTSEAFVQSLQAALQPAKN